MYRKILLYAGMKLLTGPGNLLSISEEGNSTLPREIAISKRLTPHPPTPTTEIKLFKVLGSETTTPPSTPQTLSCP